jgi:hypothetical protein
VQQAGEAKDWRLRILMQESMCKNVCPVKERENEMGGRRNCINYCSIIHFLSNDCLANTTSATARTSGNNRS